MPKPPKYVDPEELGRIASVMVQRGYVSIPNAAKLLPGSPHAATVRIWVDKGYLRHIVVGSRKVITYDEIERYKQDGNYDPKRYGVEETH